MAEQEEEEVPRPYWVPTKYEAEYGDHIPQGMASARRNVKGQGQFVLFVDILGFAELVERDEVAHIRWAAGLSSVRASIRTPPSTALTILFEKFHRVLETTLLEAKPWRPPAIVFSDSAFVAMPWLDMTCNLARSLMAKLILEEVPARMGIGFGGFSAARFSTETRGKQTHHVSEFYGTAVVRAHRAESCGVRGLRILLHPSTYDKIIESRQPQQIVLEKPVPPWFTVPLPTPLPRDGVANELNYVGTAEFVGELTRHVLAMKTNAPKNVNHYYDETLLALIRMKDGMP
jgi:hypothetical protein